MASTIGPSSAPPSPSSDRLDSWKGIAAYLNRSVKTVQRWEQEEGLPVHRHQHGQLGSLYAWRAEVDEWWEARRPVLNHDAADEPRAMPEAARVPAPTPVSPARRPGLRLALVLAAAVTAMAGATVLWLPRPAVPRPPVVRLSLDVQPARELNAGATRSAAAVTPGGSATALAWTPDGRTMVFIGQRDDVRQVYVRPLDAVAARPLVNTEGARTLAVSPDGQWVAFWTAPPGQLEPSGGSIQKVSLLGGPAIDIVTDVRVCPRGLAWDESGRLFFGQEDGPISQVAANGAVKAATTLREGELRHVLPWPLPGGRALLYTVRKRLATWGDEEIVAQSLTTGERRVLLRDGADARYIPTGHIVFLRRGVLFAVPFDAVRLQVLGKEVPVLEKVAQALTGNIWNATGAGQFAVSTAGTLAWVASPVVPPPARTVNAVDRAGRATPLSVPALSYFGNVSLSPDGRRLAVKASSVSGIDLWIFDLERGTLTLLNRGGESGSSVWSPDGRLVVFRWINDGRFAIASQPADGAEPPSVLAKGFLVPTSFAPDGRHLLAVQGSTNYDIVVVSTDKPATVEPLIATPSEEQWPAVSRDGHWLAYGSDNSGRDEIYVRPFPGPGPARQVSVDGGDNVAWNPDGRELFFLSPPDASGSRRMNAADFSSGSRGAEEPRVGRPRVLFAFPPGDVGVSCRPARCYDVAPDGRHFYAVHSPTPPPPPVLTHINVIENWFEELKAMVPPGR